MTGSGVTACEGPRTAVTATINAVPVVTIAASGPTAFFTGGTVALTASGADSYLWSTGATTASITVTAGGSYSVTGTTAAGCLTLSAATAVSVEPLPTTPSITQGSAGTLTSSAATGNQWYVGGQLIPGATNSTYVVSSAAGNGSYTVTTTSATGCSSAPSAAVTVTITATAAGHLLAGLQVLPNPAHGQATVLLPTLPAGTPATLELVDALGRVVLMQPVVAPTAGRQELNLTGVAIGVYALRLTADSATVTRRLVVE
jgi:hypothetical protein